MPCSHCGGAGHTYVKCPQLTPEQIKEKKDFALKKKEEKEKKKKMKERHNEIFQNRDYCFRNNNMYEVAVYWGFSDIMENEGKEKKRLIRLNYISAMTEQVIPISKLYRVVIFPTLEVPNPNNPSNAKKIITIDDEFNTLFKVLDVELEKYPDLIFEFSREYKPPKNELEQWKEFALKSHYLLKEIQKMTTTNKKDEDGDIIYHEKYENIDPFLKIIQDIPIPNTCTEADKEKAGIPSALTNIT